MLNMLKEYSVNMCHIRATTVSVYPVSQRGGANSGALALVSLPLCKSPYLIEHTESYSVSYACDREDGATTQSLNSRVIVANLVSVTQVFIIQCSLH